MKMLTFLFIAVSTVTFSHASEAKLLTSDSIDLKAVPSAHLAAVSPGTRLVAGDLSQNEFYILGSNPVERPVAPKPTMKVKLANKADAVKIRVALAETLHQGYFKKSKHRVKVAIKTKKQKIAKAKSHSRAKRLKLDG